MNFACELLSADVRSEHKDEEKTSSLLSSCLNVFLVLAIFLIYFTFSNLDANYSCVQIVCRHRMRSMCLPSDAVNSKQTHTLRYSTLVSCYRICWTLLIIYTMKYTPLSEYIRKPV